MKAKEVLNKLNITRPTLTKYVKEGLVKVDSEINGIYNYNEESVESLLKNGKPKIKEETEIKEKVSAKEEIIAVKEENVNAEDFKKLKQIVGLLIETEYFLANMRLLDTNSISKLNKACELFKEIKD